MSETWTKLKDYYRLLPKTVILRTSFLWLSYFCMGMADSVRGPTLLDIRDIVSASTSDISFTMMLAALGGLVGCFATGALLDRFPPHYSYCFMALSGAQVGLTTMFLPYSPSLTFVYLHSVWFGFACGCFHTCANVLMLRIWKGRNASPYLFALHFWFGVGALVAPLIARPFLKNQDDDSETIIPMDIDALEVGIIDDNMLFKEVIANSTQNHVELKSSRMAEDEYDFWTVKSLFPILGAQLCLVCIPLLYYFLKDLRGKVIIEAKGLGIRDSEIPTPETNSSASLDQKYTPATKEELATMMAVGEKCCDEMSESEIGSRKLLGPKGLKVIFLVLMCCQYFCCAGMEMTYRNFISTFTVSVGHSRQVGSDVTAFYYSSFALVRGLVIFFGFIIPPGAILWTCILTCCISSIFLTVFGVTSLTVLKVGTVFVGGGTALLYPTGLLWLETVMPVNNKISAALNVSCNTSVQVISYIIGVIIEDYPLGFMLMFGANALLMLIIFSLANILAALLRRENGSKVVLS